MKRKTQISPKLVVILSNPIIIGGGMQMHLLLPIDQKVGKIGDTNIRLAEFVIKDLVDLAGLSPLPPTLKALTLLLEGLDQFQIYLNNT